MIDSSNKTLSEIIKESIEENNKLFEEINSKERDILAIVKSSSINKLNIEMVRVTEIYSDGFKALTGNINNAIIYPFLPFITLTKALRDTFIKQLNDENNEDKKNKIIN